MTTESRVAYTYEAFADRNPLEAYANARLISAAPDLLEACIAVASAIRNLEGQEIQYSLAKDLSAALAVVDSALRKADGQ